MKLDGKQIKVLSYIHMRARARFSEVAQATGLKTHTVRYILEDFKKKGFLQPFVLVNRRCLGNETIFVHFSIRNSFKDTRQEIIQGIMNMPSCTWLMPLVGDYEYRMSLSLKRIDDLHEFFSELTERFGSFWGDRVSALDKAWYYLGRKFLLDRSYLPEPFIISRSVAEVKIDEIDRKIILSFINNPLDSVALLAERMNLPSSTLNYRIKRLEDGGIIGGYINGFSYSKIGVFAYRILVDFGGMALEVFNKFLDYATEHPHISSFNVTTGSCDLEMGVEYQTSQEIMLFLNEFNESFGEYSPKIKVLNRMDDLKWVMIGGGVLA